MELQLMILRQILLADDRLIKIDPLSFYEKENFGLGSLGILRVSKHFSALALDVLYRGNVFGVESFDTLIFRESSGHVSPYSCN